MRYFFEIQYSGTAYAGWQRQPNALTVQECIETALQNYFSAPGLEILGCGRTDTGVHASQYFFHADLDAIEDQDLLIYKLNAMLPLDIAVRAIHFVHTGAHARFDATRRSYVYEIHCAKDVFLNGRSWYLKGASHYDFSRLNDFAALVRRSTDFESFCKSRADNQSNVCQIMACRWDHFPDIGRLRFHISADRFLRGMVRLLVGCSLNIARGKLRLEEVEAAMMKGEAIDHAWSVPAEGLYLCEISYPFIPDRHSIPGTAGKHP